MYPSRYCVFVDIRAEMMPDELPDRSEVTKFDHAQLKHVQPTEKIVLPSKEGKSRDSLYKIIISDFEERRYIHRT